jgi:hypothetical protein
MLNLTTTAPISLEHRAELPIWLAALLASGCEAADRTHIHCMEWSCTAGQALYTNCRWDVEEIQAFGVRLGTGERLIVSWQPGETGYTVQIWRSPKTVDTATQA